MQRITLVTGNAHKLAEWRGLWPLDVELVSQDVDLEEIQGTLEEIAAYKAKRAFEAVGTPVIVEDVAAGLDRLGGFPGPYIKYLNSRPEVGKSSLYALAHKAGETASAHCISAYYDGNELLSVIGTVHGTVVEPRGERGFGFDYCFVPAGETRTWAEMSLEEKSLTSHRAKAVKLLAEKLSVNLGIT